MDAPDIEGVALEGQFEQHGFVLQEVELGARDLRSGFEINKVQRFGQFHMIFGIEIELCRLKKHGDIVREK